MQNKIFVGKQIADNIVETPQWIDDIKFSKPVAPKLDIDFDANIINQKHILANSRIVDTGNIRELKLTFNDKQLQVFAMNELAKFLRNYRYSAKAEVNNGVAKIAVSFSKNPLEYTFVYRDVNGKLNHDKVFTTKIAEIENEYPFSIAGIEDSFEDSKTIDLKNPTKVAQKEFDYTVMTRYEIVQRCNNRLTTAKELIEKNIKEGNIVAIGSNEYASTYDMKYLFPDMREKYAGEVNHSLEFVNNKVAERSYEKKTANRLAMEAGKILSSTFNVDKIISANRNGDNLNITSIIVHNNMRDKFSFCFNIAKEKLTKLSYIEDEKLQRYSVAQLLQKFGADDKKIATYLHGENDRIEGGYVYSLKTIKATLTKFISDVNLKSLISDWISSGKAKQLNSTTIASKYSLNELVRKAEFLPQDVIDKIQKSQMRFGENEKFYSYETKDNDTRNKEAVAKIATNKENIVSYIGKSFVDFDVNMLGIDKFVVAFNNNENKKRIVSARIFDNKILFKVGNKEVELNQLSGMFRRSALLSSYVKDKDVDLSKERKYIISKKKVISTASQYLVDEQLKNFVEKIDEILLNAEQLTEDTFASEFSMEDILNQCDCDIDENVHKEYLEKSNRMNEKDLVRNYIQDGDIRNDIALNEQEKNIANIQQRIAKYLNNFTIKMLGGDKISINFVSTDGKNRSIVAKVGDDIICNVGNKQISIQQLANNFKTSELLKNYVSYNNENDKQKVILSKRMFDEKLSDFIIKAEIDNFVKSLLNTEKMVKISEDLYATDGTFEDLLRDSDLKVNHELRKQNLAMKNKANGKELQAEYVSDNENRIAEKRVTSSDFKSQFINALPKHLACVRFNNINIDNSHVVCDVDIYNKQNGLTITANFDMKIENGIVNTESEKNLDEMFHLATINKNYNNYNAIDNEKNDVIFTKNMLIGKLQKIASVDNIDDVISNWINTSKIELIGKDKFASKYTISDLISMSNLFAYKDEDVKKQFSKANVSSNVIPKKFHIQDSDSISLNNVEDGKTKDYIEITKKSCIAKLNDLVKNNMITNNRVIALKNRINTAKTYNEINIVNKDIERYGK
mgnify:CR=1 FL=1